MKKLYFLIILSGFLCFCSSQADNIDKPIQGEWDFKLKKAWEIGQIDNNVLAGIGAIRVSKEGKVFVWDRKQFKVFVCNSRGKLLYHFGGKGEGPGEVLDRAATRLFLTNKYIILFETNSGRIHYFLHNGTFEKTEKIFNLEYARSLETFIDPNRFLFFSPGETEDKLENLLGIYNLSTKNYREISRVPG